MPWKVTYAADSLDPNPIVEMFEEQWEAIDFATEEMHRRVQFQVEHSQYSLSKQDVREIEEHETQLIRIDHI
jgi:hypothetical protein